MIAPPPPPKGGGACARTQTCPFHHNCIVTKGTIFFVAFGTVDFWGQVTPLAGGTLSGSQGA